MTSAGRTAAAVLAACFILNMLGRGLADTYTVFLLPLEREFGWTRSELTSVYSIYLLAHALTTPLVGTLLDRFGPRWVYGAGTLFLGIALFLAQGIASLWQFYLAMGVLIGLGVSLNGMVAASVLLSRWYRKRLATVMGFAFSAAGVGTVIFVPLAQYLVAEEGWRFAYRVFGYAMLGLVPVVLLALPWKTFSAGHERHREAAAKAQPGEGWTLRAALRSPLYWGLAQVFFCTSVGMYSIVVQLVAFLIDAGFTPLSAASTFGMIGMLSSCSIMGSGYIADRFGYLRTVTTSFIGTATGMLLLLAITWRPDAILLALFIPVFGLCMGTRGPIVSSICARHFAGPQVGTIYGTVYSSNAIGAAIGSVAGGLLHDLTGGYRIGLAFSLLFIGVAALPFWTIRALREYR